MNKRNRVNLVLGLVILLIFGLMTLAPGLFTAYDPKDMFQAWLPASGAHLLGTNALGYDVFTELVYGAGVTLRVGLASSVISLVLGLVIGTLSTRRGFFGSLFNGMINVFVLLPRLIVLIVLAGFLGNSERNLILLISAFSWAASARAVRAQVMHINSQLYIENCRVLGYSRFHTVVFHVIPNLYDTLVSRFLLGVNSCIMMESTLSFLGFGDLYHPTWGTMINLAYKRGAFIRGAYNYLLVPALCITLVSMAFYLISVYLENKKDILQA